MSIRSVLLAAAGFALVEYIAGLTLGQFWARDRAEATIFLAFRPWALLLLVLSVRRWPPVRRACAYAVGLLLAGGMEALLAGWLGGGSVVADAVRAFMAGALLAMLLDAAFMIARRVEPRFATALGLALGIGLLLAPGPIRWFERIALRPGPVAVSGRRPQVTVLTGLPLLWDGGPANDALTTPPGPMRQMLSDGFRVRPIEVATPAVLASTRLLFAAQPRELSAAGIDAVDAWVRMGGRALLLADPDLRWPTIWSPGDDRQPPRRATLAPLLARWNIVIARGRGGIDTVDVVGAGRVRRIVVDKAGVLSGGTACRRASDGLMLDCRIGRGRVLVLADADMLDDRLWAAPGPRGGGRLVRAGDNGVLVVELLDRLAGNPRDRSADSVSWRDHRATAWALAGAALPVVAIMLFAALAKLLNTLVRGNSRTDLSTRTKEVYRSDHG